MTPFILADRGNCSFVQKVRNMEEAGAAVGIVVDNSDEKINNVLMVDDGKGAGIRIPSMLVSKKDGEKLIRFMQTASKQDLEALAITAVFSLARPDNRVEYDIWYSSGDQKMLDFIEDFRTLDAKFGDRVLMTPHFKFFSCQNCN